MNFKFSRLNVMLYKKIIFTISQDFICESLKEDSNTCINVIRLIDNHE